MYLHPLLGGVSTEDRRAFVQQIELRSCRRHDVLLRQDEWTGHVFCVATGLVRVVVQGADANADVTTDFVRPDDVFLGPTLQEDRYQAPATLSAALAGSVYCVPVRALRELCARYPSVAAGLLELVLKRTATLRKQLRQVGSTSTERLVSGVLFELTQVAPAGTGCYDKRISQSIIASYSGLSREQVNKTMRNLEERGLVTRDEHAVHVPGGFAPTNF